MTARRWLTGGIRAAPRRAGRYAMAWNDEDRTGVVGDTDPVMGRKEPGRSSSRAPVHRSPAWCFAVAAALVIAACGSDDSTTTVAAPDPTVVTDASDIDGSSATTGATPTTDEVIGTATSALESGGPTVAPSPEGTTGDTASAPASDTTTIAVASTEAAETTPTTTVAGVTTTAPAEEPEGTGTESTSVATTQAEATTPSTTQAPTTTQAPATTTATTQAPTTVKISDDVPDIKMFDTATGDLVSLRSVVKGEKPLMFWFWSPY